MCAVTCQFFFSRLTDRQVLSFEIDRIRSALQRGILTIDENANAFCEVVPNGEYTLALFSASPRQSGVNGVPDYFAAEQRLTWTQLGAAANWQVCWDPDFEATVGAYRENNQYDQILFEYGSQRHDDGRYRW